MNQWLFQAPIWMLLVIPGLAIHWAARIVRGQERQVSHSHRLLEMLGWGFLAWAGVGLVLLLVVPWNWPLIPLLLVMLLSCLYVRRRWHQMRMLHAWETLRLADTAKPRTGYGWEQWRRRHPGRFGDRSVPWAAS
jgi:fatty acid desaturase